MEKKNEMRISFDSYSENEGFARVSTAAFLTSMNPTLDELEDIKTAVSEAVTNCIIHGYNQEAGKISLECTTQGQEVVIKIEDTGNGIEDIETAMRPFYTTRPEEERSGMGFAFMEAFMDEVQVESEPGVGTSVIMRKKIGNEEDSD